MKKTRKWSYLFMTAFMILSFGACQDWGEMDPPAGNQVYPKLEQVASITFEEEEFDPASMNYYAYEGGELANVVSDNAHGQVLHLPNGYARLFNPLNSVKVQNGVSLTFWLKQAVIPEDEIVNNSANDIEGALFSFQNENGTQRMYLTANGWLKYEGVDGEYEANSPTEYKTGILSDPGEWHYVAVCVTNDGYTIYVDGLKKLEKTETSFDFSKIVQFMGTTPYLYIGYGSDTNTKEMWVDDINVYRNQITSKEIKMPGTDEEEIDYRNYVIIGEEDCSTGWWTAFSKLFTMKGEQSIHFGFYNYTDQSANWNNWLIVVTNGKDRNETGYAEHFVLRSDAYGWGDSGYNGDNISNDFNFDTFTTDMNGAYVDLTLTRDGNTLTMKAVITTVDETVYNYSFTYEGTLEETIGAFLTCEKSYLKLDVEQSVTGNVYGEGDYVVGPTDCTAGWWSYFSDFSKISGDTEYPFVHVFYNNTSMANNWNNWVMVITNGKDRNESGYEEYVVLRADAYGWGSLYNGDNITNSFDWDTFTSQMNGAYCRVAIERDGTTLKMTAKTRTADGELLGDYTFTCDGIASTDIGIFFTLEQASLDFRSVGYMPYWSQITQ